MKTTNYQDRVLSRNLEIIQALEQGLKPQQVAASFGISVATVYNIRKQAEHGGILALVPKSKAPKTKPKRDDLIIQLILSVRRETGFGAEKIYDYLVSQAHQLGIQPSQIPKARTLHEILKQHNQVVHVEPKRKRLRPDYYQTRAKEHPNDILEADMKTDHFLEGRPVIVNGIIDICSKVVTVSINTSQATEHAALTLVDHVYQWGVAKKLKNDNDMAYIGQVEGASLGLFTRVCLLLGMEQIFIPVHRPKWNPHIESFFRTWDNEFYTQIHHWGWDALGQGNRGYIRRYLLERSHQGLKKLANNPERIKFPQPYHQKYAKLNVPSWNKQEVIELIKKKEIPLIEGKVSFIRKTPEDSTIRFKQNKFHIPKSYVGMMVKGTIFVQPNRDKLQVDIYFRDHKIITATYQIKPYKHGKF